MRSVVPVLLIALAGCGGTIIPDDGPPPPPPPPPPWSPDMQAVADGGNRFALDLYGQLRDKPGNLFFSPYSVHAALAMTADGANGTTRDQMVKVLHLPADRDKALVAGDLGRYYSAGGRPYELSVANALWGQTGFPWRPEFLARQNERFGAGFHEVDFKGDRDGTVDAINRWVAEKTRDKITNLLSKEDVPVYERAQITRMVLTNAIYFKGKWADQFKPELTRDGPFHKADGGRSQMPFMHRTGSYRHADLGDFQVLEMPYKGDELSMVVVLPRKADGLPAVEKQLTADSLSGWVAKLQSAQVAVQFPRFKMEQRFELNKGLSQLGMEDAFDPKVSDFTAMADLQGQDPLFISKVIHQSFVEVNEEGTVAAAATAVGMAQPTSAPPPPIPFHADRPFLFLIRDAKHGTILFLGRLTDPSR